jgi:phosphatidylserine decarboxylase
VFASRGAVTVRIDPAGLPFIAIPAAVGIVVGAAFSWLLAIPLFVVAGFCLYFFRDPERRWSPDPGAGPGTPVLSPADGRVLVAGPADPHYAPEGVWQQVSIFLSPMNVHVNRVPVGGKVTRVSYTPGKFLPAYRADAGASNERCEIWIDHNGTPIVARQLVGILARRVVCRLDAGATVSAGDRYGIMKFGSRMDVFLPQTADIRVQIGDSVVGGLTIIAMLHSD